MSIELSVVVPVFNEEDSLPLLADRLQKVLDSAGVSFEILFIDDGSSDNSAKIMRQLNLSDARFRYCILSRNFGHEAASTCGFKESVGACVALMDADLQDPPELLLLMLEKWREGYEIVQLRRAAREGESVITRLTSYIFYRVMSAFSEVPMPTDVGDFRLVDRRVVEHFNALPERNRYVRGIFPWLGFRQTILEYQRPARVAGVTKYNIFRRLSLSFDAITGFSLAPLRLCIATGFLVTFVSLIMAGVIIFQRLFLSLTIPGYALLTTGLFMLGGVQLTFLGVMGEYIGKIYTEVRARPQYIVAERSTEESE